VVESILYVVKGRWLQQLCSDASDVSTLSDRPWSPGQPAVTSITRRSVVLSWYGCGYDGGSTVTGYRIEKQQLQAGTPSTDDQYWQCVTDSCKVSTSCVVIIIIIIITSAKEVINLSQFVCNNITGTSTSDLAD